MLRHYSECGAKWISRETEEGRKGRTIGARWRGLGGGGGLREGGPGQHGGDTGDSRSPQGPVWALHCAPATS